MGEMAGRLAEAEAEIARLRRDRAEGLARESATREILRVIATSPTSPQRVLDTIVEAAGRLCDAPSAAIQQFREHDQHMSVVAITGPMRDGLQRRFGPLADLPGVPATMRTAPGRAYLEGRTIHVPDMLQAVESEYPDQRGGQERGGYRTLVSVPLMRGGGPIGVLNVHRFEVHPFTEQQIALLETFADQAVIAIENARLFEELERRNAELLESNRRVTEALGRQAATAEILGLIAGSPTDPQHVLQAIAESAARLCDARGANVALVHGGMRLSVAAVGFPDSNLGRTVPLDRHDVAGRALSERRTIHVPDLAAVWETEFPDSAFPRHGYHTVVATPLIRSEAPIGVLMVSRLEARSFTDDQIRLLETFADQAVIAIENARLFNELAELNRTLEVRVREQVGELERAGRLRRYLSPQLANLIMSSGDESMLDSHRRQITVVFCDLRGFTAFAEMAEPEEVMGVLNAYHAAMGDQIRRFDGTLDHFAGDGLIVFFNDPLPQPDHTERAVRMACAMRERAADLARGWRRAGHGRDFGVGIAMGYATLGRIGFEGRYDYTAIGSVANLAARLCGEAAGGQILIPARLHGMVESLIRAELIGHLSLKGFHRPVEAFNVLALQEAGSAPPDQGIGQAGRDARRKQGMAEDERRD